MAFRVYDGSVKLEELLMADQISAGKRELWERSVRVTDLMCICIELRITERA